MNSFEEVWLVNSDSEVSELLKHGWKLIQVVYEEHKQFESGWFSSKFVGTVKHAKFLMGRPEKAPPRKKEDYYVSNYVDRLKEKKRESSHD